MWFRNSEFVVPRFVESICVVFTCNTNCVWVVLLTRLCSVVGEGTYT